MLKDTDYPLLERIARGPDETSGVKIYLKDRIITTRKNSLVTQAVREEEEEEEEGEGEIEQIEEPVKVEQSLPDEVGAQREIILKKFDKAHWLIVVERFSLH